MSPAVQIGCCRRISCDAVTVYTVQFSLHLAALPSPLPSPFPIALLLLLPRRPAPCAEGESPCVLQRGTMSLTAIRSPALRQLAARSFHSGADPPDRGTRSPHCTNRAHG